MSVSRIESKNLSYNQYQPFGGFGKGFGGFKNLGQSIRQQAEELNAKAKEAAKKVEDFQASKLSEHGSPQRGLQQDQATVGESSNVSGSDNDAENNTNNNASLASREPDSVSKEELLEIQKRLSSLVEILRLHQ